MHSCWDAFLATTLWHGPFRSATTNQELTCSHFKQVYYHMYLLHYAMSRPYVRRSCEGDSSCGMRRARNPLNGQSAPLPAPATVGRSWSRPGRANAQASPRADATGLQSRSRGGVASCSPGADGWRPADHHPCSTWHGLDHQHLTSA